MNTSGKKGSSEASGLPGVLKSADNPYVEQTDWDWDIDPVGLRIALRRIDSRCNLPILTTENGLGAYDDLEEDGSIHDDYRIDFIRKHVKAVQEAITDGVNVLGYCTWSYTDLLRWLNGYRSGMVLSTSIEKSWMKRN